MSSGRGSQHWQCKKSLVSTLRAQNMYSEHGAAWAEGCSIVHFCVCCLLRTPRELAALQVALGHSHCSIFMEGKSVHVAFCSSQIYLPTKELLCNMLQQHSGRKQCEKLCLLFSLYLFIFSGSKAVFWCVSFHELCGRTLLPPHMTS